MAGRAGMLTCGLALLLLAVLSVRASATNLSAGTWRPATHPLTAVGYEGWARTVATRSGGELKVRVNDLQRPISPQAHLKALRDGQIDVGHHLATYTQDEMPELAALSAIAPRLKDNLAAVLAISEFALTDEGMLARFKTQGVVFGGGYALPAQMLACRSLPMRLADLRGLKMRFANPIRRQWATSVGAVGVGLPLSDTPTAIRQGLVDCVAGDAYQLASIGILTPEINLVALDVGIELSGWQYAFNRATWRKLSGKSRRILLDTIAEQIPLNTEAHLNAAREAERVALAAGVTKTAPSNEIAASLEAFLQSAAPARAHEIAGGRLNAPAIDALITGFMSKYARWQKLLATIDRGNTTAVGALLRREVYDKLDENAYGLN